MLPASVVLVRGIVRGLDGSPIPDVRVLFLTLDAAGHWTGSYDSLVRSDANGRLHLPVQAGTLYRIVAGTDVGPNENVEAPPDPSRPPRVELPVFEAASDLPLIDLLLPD